MAAVKFHGIRDTKFFPPAYVKNPWRFIYFLLIVRTNDGQFTQSNNITFYSYKSYPFILRNHMGKERPYDDYCIQCVYLLLVVGLFRNGWTWHRRSSTAAGMRVLPQTMQQRETVCIHMHSGMHVIMQILSYTLINVNYFDSGASGMEKSTILGICILYRSREGN